MGIELIAGLATLGLGAIAVLGARKRAAAKAKAAKGRKRNG